MGAQWPDIATASSSHGAERPGLRRVRPIHVYGRGGLYGGLVPSYLHRASHQGEEVAGEETKAWVAVGDSRDGGWTAVNLAFNASSMSHMC
jgi:hypothetical protein